MVGELPPPSHPEWPAHAKSLDLYLKSWSESEVYQVQYNIIM